MESKTTKSSNPADEIPELRKRIEQLDHSEKAAQERSEFLQEILDSVPAIITAWKIFDVLPLTASLNTWGDEIYFSLPINSPLDETSKEVVEIGDLGYWPPGSAFFIFFGMTPMSTMSSSGKIVPASAVNVIGKILGDPEDFKMVMSESKVPLEPA